MKPETRMRYQSVPHPNPLPRGEGTAIDRIEVALTVRVSDSTFCSSSARTLTPMTLGPTRNGRKLFPLPGGEGQGEGQTTWAASHGLRVGFEPTKVHRMMPPRTRKSESANLFITGSLSTRAPEADEKLTRAGRRVAHFAFCISGALNSQRSTLN